MSAQRVTATSSPGPKKLAGVTQLDSPARAFSFKGKNEAQRNGGPYLPPLEPKAHDEASI